MSRSRTNGSVRTCGRATGGRACHGSGWAPVAEHYAAPDEHQTPEITEEPIARIAPDDDLEDGWRAAMPSARFVSTAIACAGAGLIIAGLAMRFQTL